MSIQLVERQEKRRACDSARPSSAANNMSLQVRIEGLFLDDAEEAQRCLASYAQLHLAQGNHRTQVGRLESGEWTVQAEGENGRWLVMRPVTSNCAHIDEVHWEVWVNDSEGSALSETPLLREHLGLDPTLVTDLADLALSSPGVQQRFTPRHDG